MAGTRQGQTRDIAGTSATSCFYSDGGQVAAHGYQHIMSRYTNRRLPTLEPTSTDDFLQLQPSRNIGRDMAGTRRYTLCLLVIVVYIGRDIGRDTAGTYQLEEVID